MLLIKTSSAKNLFLYPIFYLSILVSLTPSKVKWTCAKFKPIYIYFFYFFNLNYKIIIKRLECSTDVIVC